MASSLAQNAIAFLIELAERGEVDPWDVDVIDVIDRFLSKLQPTPTAEAAANHEPQSGRAPYEADLSESGQAFLYASMLLLLKADSLARLEVPDEPENPFDEGDLLFVDSFVDAPLPLNLERQIRRRAAKPPFQNRRVTLQDLIAQLNMIADAMAEDRPRRLKTLRPRPQSRTQAIKAISELAHQENLSEIAAILEQFLLTYWEDIDRPDDWLDFEILLELWASQAAQPPPPSPSSRRRSKSAASKSTTQDQDQGKDKDEGNGETTTASVNAHKHGKANSVAAEVASAATPTIHDRVGVFWALLFLSAQSKVELEQERFYEDLRVRSLGDANLPHASPAQTDPVSASTPTTPPLPE